MVAVDVLNTGATDPSILTIAATVLVGYGAARASATLFQELRNAVFGTVSQSAIRSAARHSFNHLIRLDIGFHLSRQTGGLVRAIDRGTKGIQQILGSVVFHLFPTALEVGIVCTILTVQYGIGYAVVTLVSVACLTLLW